MKLKEVNEHDKVSRRRRVIKFISTIAASFLLIVGIIEFYSRDISNGNMLYTEGYIERDGCVMTGDDIAGDIEAAFVAGYCLEDEIEYRILLNELSDNIIYE